MRFPVISLKVLSFVSMGGDDHTKIRNHALAFVGGVMSSINVTALIIIRSSGSMIGWGYQLWSCRGWNFNFNHAWYWLDPLTNINIGAGLTTLGSSAIKNSYSGSFFTGVLAVLLPHPAQLPLWVQPLAMLCCNRPLQLCLFSYPWVWFCWSLALFLL